MALKLTWLGSATFRLEDSAGHVVFVDPWLDAPPGNPECPIGVNDIERADLVLVTHGDPAHFGRGDAARIAARTGCRFASSPALCDYVVAKGLLPESQVVRLAMHEPKSFGFLDVTMFPVIHPPYDDDTKPDIPRDPNAGFAITMGGVPVLYTGDTVLGDEVYAGVATKQRPLIALLPIRVGTASDKPAKELAEAPAAIAETVRPRYIIPHYRYRGRNAAVPILADAVRPLGVEVLDLQPGGSFSAGD